MPRAPKKCGRLGCETRVIARVYCDVHTAEAQARANTTQRGYGADHQAERERWEPAVAAGRAHCHAEPCWMPDTWIPPGTAWHLGHNQQRTRWTGPEHPLCNTRNAARSKGGPGSPSAPTYG